DEADAKNNRRGLWAGCFVAPQDFRRWNKRSSQILGSSCSRNAHDIPFPEHPAMPPGCPIRATYAWQARAQGYRGIYHTKGCRSYRTTTNPKRWFCSEEDAVAEGFRKTYRC